MSFFDSIKKGEGLRGPALPLRQGRFWAEGAEAREVAALGIWGEKSNTAFVFDPPYARNSKISNDAFEVFASACHAAKRMDPQGTIVTILPSPEIGLLDHLKISKRTNVMGVEWGYIHQKLEEIGWGIELAIPTRVHKSLVRIIIRATAISDQE